MADGSDISRRNLLIGLAAGAAAATVGLPGKAEPMRRTIPSSGQPLPAIGMGTWITFNVGENEAARIARSLVLQAFFEAGGGMIDSSPMYGSSEAVVGYGLDRLERPAGLFSATKVWTGSSAEGPQQVAASSRLWGVERFNLLQVHNLLNWQAHLEMLKEMKAAGRVGHIGITTSHGRRHDEFEQVMRAEPLDFVQVTYNAVDREVEERILPLAAERGIAVIANRPFRQGGLPDRAEGTPLPGWAAELGCQTWAQAMLKFIVSHPAITCAIPATTRVGHMKENMAAGSGAMPDARLRARIAADVADL